MINQILFLYNFNKQNINKVYFKNSIKYHSKLECYHPCRAIFAIESKRVIAKVLKFQK